MKKFQLAFLTALLVLVLAACSSSKGETDQQSNEGSKDKEDTPKVETVEITDAQGKVTVPVNPERVVALDNRTFQTLEDWGIKLAAAPKPIMPTSLSYVNDEAVKDIGNHREPNLETIAAVDPQLVIVGQRFASYYEEIKKLVPNAVVINLDIDVSENADKPGENFVNGLKDATMTLGKIFDKNKEADQLVADFDQAIADAKEAYNPEETVMSVIVSGGTIGYSAPGNGRVWGPMYEIFGWTPALDVADTTSDHQGDEVSVEAIAQSNPDWIFVLDRDAAVSSAKDAVPAQDVIDNSPALQNTKAIVEKNLVYAPNDTYTNESIQTYIELFHTLKDTLSK